MPKDFPLALSWPLKWTRLSLLALVFFWMGSTSAQNIDLSQKTAGSETDAYFLMLPSSDARYGKTSHIRAVMDNEAFFKDEMLKEVFSLGEFLLVKVQVNEEGPAYVQLIAPVWFNNTSELTQAKRTRDGEYLSRCQEFDSGVAKGQVACLFFYRNASNDIPRSVYGDSVGKIRKLLAVNDMIVMTTDIGHIVVAEIFGDYDRPRSELSLAYVPSKYRNDLLAQDLTRIHMGYNFYEMVVGVNGLPFGSKLASFNGDSGNDRTNRSFYRFLSEDWDDPLFEEIGRSQIVVPLSPVASGALSVFPGLKKSSEYVLDIRSLKGEER